MTDDVPASPWPDRPASTPEPAEPAAETPAGASVPAEQPGTYQQGAYRSEQPPVYEQQPGAQAAAPTVEPVPAAVASAGPEEVEPAVPAGDETPLEQPARRSRSGKPVKPKQHRSFLKELPILVGIAFVLALLIKHFLVQAFFIPSGSMEQTLMVGDRVLVNKVPYHFRGPHRGEIVVFNGLDNFDEGVTFAKPTNPIAKAARALSNTIGLGTPDEKDYIKRVIGVPGDRVMCCDAQGNVVVTPKGGKPQSLNEPYIFDNDTSDNRYFCDAGTGRQLCPPGALGVLVPPKRLWVMGDHRGNSSDSRFHLNDAHRGTVPENKVVGRAFAVVYPFGHAKLLHVPGTFSHVALPAVPWLGGFAGALPLTLARRRRHRVRAARRAS